MDPVADGGLGGDRRDRRSARLGDLAAAFGPDCGGARGRHRTPDGTGQPWIGRWPLAIVCFIVGFAFTVFQDVGDWVTYSDHSWQQLGIYVGKGLGFDAIHATGCLLFALAFGPALTRSIQRFARRLQVRWLPSSAVAPVGRDRARRGGLVAGLPRAGNAARAASGLGGPVNYLLGAQNADGGFGAGPGQSSSSLYSGWAALGLAAAGENPARVEHGSRGLLGYLKATAGSAQDVGSIERTILVVRAAGLSARSFGGPRPGRDARAPHQAPTARSRTRST